MTSPLKVPADDRTQLDTFKLAAPELETNHDEGRFRERLARVVKHNPAKPS